MKPKSRSRNSRQTGSLANRRFGLDHLYQSAPVGLCLMDRDLRYVRINEQLAAINGKSVAEHIGRTLREVIPEIAQQVEPMYRGVLDTGRPVLNVEVRGMTPAEPGVEKYWLTSYFPVKANGGAVEGVNTVVQDITDRKRAQEALRASEERLRLLVESTDVIPWEADAQTWRFTYVGPQAVKILGYPLDQWYEGDFWVAHIHPEDREYAVAFCVESSKQARDYEFEYRMLSADGKTIWLHDLVSVESVGGMPKKLRGFMIDITGRKQTEQALRESEARYRAVVEGSLQGMYVHRDGIIEFANDTLARMLGYASTRELTGQHYRVLLAPHERARLEGYRVARLQGEAAPPRYEFQGLRKDGTPVSLECLASLVSWDRKPAILTTFLDITDRKRAQQALEERLHFENLLSTVCREFVSRPASEAAGAMEWALESVSAFLQADRSAVLEFTEDKTKLRVTHYWCSDGMTPRFSVNDVVPVDYLPWLKDKLLQGEVVYASRIDDLPDEAGAYKLYCQRAGMRSVLNIPLVADGSTLGKVVFVSERSELTWPEDIIQRARLVGEIFANVLTRKRADEALRKSEATLQNRERDLRILAGKLLSAQEEERRR
ncbi:MAG: PAS domain S-box protein, partial [Nitrospiraceae bacterium]